MLYIPSIRISKGYERYVKGPVIQMGGNAVMYFIIFSKMGILAILSAHPSNWIQHCRTRSQKGKLANKAIKIIAFS